MNSNSSNDRDSLVDTLRGWAILGVLLGNFSFYYYLDAGFVAESKDLLTTSLEYVLRYLFSSKSWTLLSVLFGYGFAVLLTRMSKAMEKSNLFFLKRMLILLGIAFIHTLIFWGDILRDYALLGMLLLVFYRFHTRTIFIVGLVLLIGIPFVSPLVRNVTIDYTEEIQKLTPLFHSSNFLDFLQYNLFSSYFYEIVDLSYSVTVHWVMLACMLFGVIAYRIDFFNQLRSNIKITHWTFGISLLLSVVLYVLIEVLRANDSIILKYFRPGYWASICAMLVFSSGIFWLQNSGRLARVFSYFQAVGRMTLTNYLMSSLVIAVLFSGVGFHVRAMPLWFYIAVAVILYVAQLFFSKWWLRKFAQGPVEKIWRMLASKKLGG